LPEEAIESLAREVMTRLSWRAAKLKHHHDLPSQIEIERFCRALVWEDRDAATSYIGRIRREGVSVEVIYLSYLARAAQRLGEWWESDAATFAEVTIGTSRIYAIMRALRSQTMAIPATGRKSAAFASVPDEDHTLGVTMAADLFRQRGWEIDLKVGLTYDELVRQLAESHAMLIGLSASGQHSLATLARLIVALRLSNPTAMILVSGHIVATDRDTLSMLDVDGLATDYEGALSEMERLSALLSA
jgi:methanogenic corrinoid protein MtbC1